MRYWVYINDKVEGPFEEDKLVTLEGFTPDTLICSETTEAGANQEWVKASTVFEFDPLESTITRALPTPEELNTAVTPAGTTDPNLTQALKEAHYASQIHTEEQPAAQPSQDATQLILAKLDSLTREIEDLKQKMEEVITAASAQHPALGAATQAQPLHEAMPSPDVETAHTITLTNRDMSSELPTPMDDSAANTESLVSQAESLVAQANQAQNKTDDFLHGIDLSSDATPSEPPAEMPLGGKGEEEVVLRSALDSLYSAKVPEEQTEKEKEATFQDLLNPNKGKTSTQEPAAKPTLEDALKATEAAQPTQEQKEEVLQQFAPSEHKDFIAEALAEAEKENQAKQQAAAKPQEQEAAHPLEGLTPVTPEQEAAIKTDLPQPEQEVPVLSIGGEDKAPAAEEKPAEAPAVAMEELPQMPQAEAPQEAPADTRDMGEEVPLKTVSSMMPGLASLGAMEQQPRPEQGQPQAAPAVEEEKEHTETIQELVPGAKLEDTPVNITPAEQPAKEETNANLISADDLKNVEQTPGQDDAAIFDSPLPAAEQPAVQEQPQQGPQEMQTLEPAAAEAQPVQEEPQMAAMPQTAEPPVEQPAADLEKTSTQAEYSPNDLTEIELKEGSTYLISDFVPPAQASDFAAAAQDAMARSQDALKNAAKDAQKTEELAVEEVVPAKQQQTAASEAAPAPQTPVPGADVTVSQIILENTIKTKRGAALDIKTVPMVKDPAESQRLDLSDTELQDVTMQHDVKSADLQPAPKKAKTLVMVVLLLVLIGAIYAGVAYLQLIPDNMNFINPKPAVPTAEQQAQMEEMLPTAPQQPAQAAAPQISPTDQILTEVKNYAMPNGMTLEQLIVSRHPNSGNMIEWTISSAVDPDNYSIMAKVPPENPQSFKISYRFNYNTVTKALEPTISDSKNLLTSVGFGQNTAPAAMPQQRTAAQQAMPQTGAAVQAVPPAPRQAAAAQQRPVR